MSVCLICKNKTPLNLRATIKQKPRLYCSTKCIKKAYRLNHPEKDRISKQTWLENNPTKRKDASKSYTQRNKTYYREYSSLRTRHMSVARLKSLTEWDEFYIREFYDLASRRGLEVDHIIPIKHPLVCGLHVPENLQMLTRSVNARKSNKFSIDEDIIVRYEKEVE
jgi:5-methylcytosine-specific restriction endonuclease McrA